ncbi:uncharacterized protein [Antedon mediterranea]|uniref:uncharacterized protein n=1 Tax=Antedon mediterranea TaxID=105859 RepID=UPI003AF65082
MKAYIVSVFVCILLFFNINVPFCAASRKGSASRDGWRSKIGDDARDPGLGPSLGGSCQFQERAIVDVEENKIIRTKDSIDKGACFADAIVVRSIDECSDKCCSYSGGCNAQCDTTIFVHEPEDEVNCFLFVCGNGHGKCEFSHHTGYTTTKLSNRRKKIDSHVDKPLTTLTAFQQTSTYPPPTTTRKALPMLTTQTLATTKEEEISRQGPPQKEMPEDTKISGCEHHQFQCADSGECFVFEYVCDGIIDCKDNSDETDCGGYATTVDIITPAPITHQSNNLKVSKAPGLSSQDIAPESKKDFTSTHVASGGVKKERVEGIDDGFSLPDSDKKKYDPGLTQQLHSKGHEGNEDDLTLNDLQKDLNALSGKNVGKDRKDQNDDFKNENQKAKDKPVDYDGIEDYESSKIWGYDEEEDIENQKPQDLYDTKYEDDEHEEEKESLKSRGKNRQDFDYPAYEKSLENNRKQDGYDSQPIDGYKKKVYPEGMRENPSSVERGEMSYNSEENLDDRPVYKAVGRKPDKVLQHSRKNGRPKFEDGSYHSNGNPRVISLENTDKERLGGSQKSDKEHRNLPSEKLQDDGPKEDWNDKITETAGSSKELMRDKGEKWLQPPLESGPNDDGYQHRGQIDNTPDGEMLDKEVNSRNRNRGWPENADVDRQQTQMKDHEDYIHQKKPKTGGEHDGQSNVPSRNYINKWEDRQRRPDHQPKYHHQQAVPDWYNDRGRRPDYPYREYDYIGRGENPRQFWNQYRNDQFKQPHRVVSGNNADLYQPLSINDDYDNIASFDDEINDDTDDYTTTKQSTSAYEVEKTTVKPMTTKSIVSPTNKSFTEISGNITASPKKTVANNSNNKNGSSHSTLFKKKSSVPDKSLTSAILPLAFGLLITVLLLLLVGCRLRQVNRRLRYGRLKTNVAEADYLINGMYL